MHSLTHSQWIRRARIMSQYSANIARAAKARKQAQLNETAKTRTKMIRAEQADEKRRKQIAEKIKDK
jgi:hypothetical protein